MKALWTVVFVAVSLGAIGAARGVETVRVDAGGGAPRLLVDGKPVRARVFWGAPGTRPLRIGPTPQVVSFEFTPPADEPARATMHFRFGQAPGELVLDDIEVTDLTAGGAVFPTADFEGGADSFARSWTFWPTGAANTVGAVRVEKGVGRDGSAGLKVTLKAPSGDHWPDFHLYHLPRLALHKGHRYRVRFWARASTPRELTVAFYRPGDSFVFLGGPGGVFEAQIRLAAAVGVDLVSFPVDLPWPPPGRPVDWSTADAQCQTVLDANPKALLMPRIGVDPPAWWLKAHPDDAMRWDDGKHERPVAVVASPVYRRDAAERLAALVAHLEEKFGPHVAGYHPCGQNTGEWFYQDTWLNGLNGYAPADERAWRRWLAGRYPDDAARKNVAIPSPAARRAAPSGVLRDPATERALIDFAAFQQEAMAECVCQLAAAVRKASRGRKLVLFFYGYGFEFGAIRLAPSTSGHYALRRVLNCPDVDVLCSPISYFDRGLGQGGPAMSAAESVALAGKLWLSEDDTRTHLGTGTFPGWQDGATTLDQTNRLLLRNTAQCAIRNFGTWWMDLGATGWFDDARMWAEMGRLRALDEPLLRRPLPYRPDVAVVLDERSLVRVAAGGHVVTVPGVYEVRRPLGRMGAPYGQYLQDDVAAGRVRAKVVVFLTAWCASPAERKKLLAATEGSVRVWCYAPGWQEDERTSEDGMRELTGFRLRRLTGVKAWATPTAAGKELGLRDGFGVHAAITPLFAATDARPEETLARYPDGSAAVALRRASSGWSLFVGAPGLTVNLLRLAARRGGVHLYTDAECNVYASGPYLTLHAAHDGPLTVDTGRPGPVRDLLTGQRIGIGPRLPLTLKKGETRVLKVEEASH